LKTGDQMIRDKLIIKYQRRETEIKDKASLYI